MERGTEMTENRKTVTVDSDEFRRLKRAVNEMQGHVFYCEDGEGLLRRWKPPTPFSGKEYGLKEQTK